MCIPKQIIKPTLISINELSNQDNTIENTTVSNIESNTESNTEKSIIDLYNATPVPYVPSVFEKLLTNMSNKLGLSLAIYQK